MSRCGLGDELDEVGAVHQRYRSKRGSSDTDLMLRGHHETAKPALVVLGGEDRAQDFSQSKAPRVAKAEEEQTSMGTWNELPDIGEVQILGYKESIFVLSGLPKPVVILAYPTFVVDGLDVVAQIAEPAGQRRRQVLVQLDLQWTAGSARTGISSIADAAAKAMTARTACSSSDGKSSRISGIVAPSTRLASTVRTVTRVARRTGSPPQILGS